MNDDDKQEDPTNTAQDRLRAANALYRDVRELRQLSDLADANNGIIIERAEPSKEREPERIPPPDAYPPRILTKADIVSVVTDVLNKHAALQAPKPVEQSVTVAARMKSYMPEPPDAATTLERQIASCAVMIEEMSDWVMRNTSPNELCFQYMKRISNLLVSSSTAAQTAGRLRGVVWETRHVTTATHERVIRGEGVAKT
jgi:hypothetical protein